MCYVARKPCGCIVAATVDTPDMQKSNPKQVMKWMRKGLVIDRVTVQHVRESWFGWDCPHETPQPKQPKLI